MSEDAGGPPKHTRAARLAAPGRPLQVEQVDLDAPGTGEVVIEMRFAAVNPLDGYVAEGRAGDPDKLPRTLGVEGAGYVDGRPVFVRGGGLGLSRDGVWSRWAVVPADTVVAVPAGVELRQAAAVGVVGTTAWRVVHEYAQVRADDRVLVLGAGGGVGSLLVPLARNTGATVWGQVGDPGKQGFVRARGAAAVVLADAAGLTATVAELAPTVVLDGLGDGFFAAAIEALAPGGRLVSFGTSAGPEVTFNAQRLYRKGLTLRGYNSLGISAGPVAAAGAALLAEMAAGRVDIPIDDVVPLAEVNAALARLRDRAVTGKIVLDMGG
jgi:NADPH2:quinone reductase